MHILLYLIHYLTFPMKQQDALVQLIKSLSKQEKRYFKLHSHLQAGDKLYVKIFDKILEQKEYNEKAIQSELKIIHFSAAKNKLYTIVLDCLRTFHKKKLATGHIHQVLETSYLLYNKGLLTQAEKQIKKGITLALKHESYSYLIELYKFQRYILFSVNTGSESAFKRTLQLNKNIQHAIEKLSNETAYSILMNTVSNHSHSKGQMSDMESDREMQKLMSSPLLTEPSMAGTKHGQMLAIHSKFLYHFNQHDFKGAHKLITQMKTLIVDSDFLPEWKYRHLYLCIINCILCEIEIKKYELALKNIDELDNMILPSVPDQRYMDFMKVLLRIYIYKMLSDFEKGIRISEKYDKEVLSNKTEDTSSIPKHHIFNLYLLSFNCYFGAKKYSQAIQWLNRIINLPYTGIRKDIVEAVQTIRLILYFEMNKMDLLESALKSLIRAKTTLKADIAIIDFFKTYVLKTDDTKKTEEGYSQLREKLTEAFKDKKEAVVREYFDYIEWIDGKVKRK